ncbi:MAG: discoidin domain-containing protein [bacterium]
MNCRRVARGVCIALLVVAGHARAQLVKPAPPVSLVTFDDTTGWRAIPSDGVRLALHPDSGVVGRAMRFDFDYQGHAGYAIARHAFVLPALPAHWAMTLHVRGDARPNTIEIKFVDASGLNVWWMRRVALPVSREWQVLRFRPSDLSFAWGPLGKGPPRSIAAIEIAITAASGGNGWISLDDLTLVPLPMPVADSTRPSVSASTSAAGHAPASMLSRDFFRSPTYATARGVEATGWRSGGDGEQHVTFNFRGPRELSGLAVDWGAADWATDYDVQRSDDGAQWTTMHTVRGGAGGRRFVHLPELETSWLRLVLRKSSRGKGYGIAAVRFLPATAAPTRSAFLETVAAADAPGGWPRALTHQQSYWTVVGIPRDERDALISEDGAVEPFPGSFSLEPFLSVNGAVQTWRDGVTTHALDGGWRPIPSVRRTANDAALDVTSFATGDTGSSMVWARYRVINRKAVAIDVQLHVAVRPVQVNPPWQFLGIAGGAASVRSLAWDGQHLSVNGEHDVTPLTPGATVRAATFDAGSLIEELRRCSLPRSCAASTSRALSVADATEFASALLTWNIRLAANDSTDVWLQLPARKSAAPGDAPTGAAALETARRMWDSELGRVRIDLPLDGAAIANTIRSAMSDVLINARGAAIQPGTRSYRRSWIRDGALTSAALLRLGRASDVRAFIDWFVPNVFADGKVPCCVDVRGADPVPENDADGELLYLVAEYVRMSGDTATARRHWPILARTAAHLDSLRQSRRTARYRSADSLFVFGLLPPSISHEGYSAKAAYSYWDDWWGVRGLTDAAFLAGVAGDGARARTLGAAAAEFKGDVVASIGRAMALHTEPVLPGAADLGDFDPTSSTIALEPAQGLSALPTSVVRRTFDSAWVNFTNRRDGKQPWINYTPYEWRQVGSFVRLNQPERAHALARWYMTGRRPAEWNQWAEVVWRDHRAPKFIGDMPHGWVASDFIRSALDFIEYERADDSTLVIGAGIPLTWARAPGGVTVQGIHTWWGTLDLSVRAVGAAVQTTVRGVMPPGGIEVRAPFGAVPRAATVNGAPASFTKDGRAVVIRAPGRVEFRY